MKKTRLMLSSLRLLVGTVSGLSLFFGNHGSMAQTPVSTSPLLAQSPAGQAMVLRTLDLIRDNAGGYLDLQNAGRVIQNVIAAHPGISPTLITGALNQMQLSPEVLKESLDGAAAGFDASPSDMIGALLADTYINQGRGPATEQIEVLRSVFGDPLVNMALNNTSMERLVAPDDLAQIDTSAGGLYDG